MTSWQRRRVEHRRRQSASEPVPNSAESLGRRRQQCNLEAARPRGRQLEDGSEGLTRYHSRGALVHTYACYKEFEEFLVRTVTARACFGTSFLVSRTPDSTIVIALNSTSEITIAPTLSTSKSAPTRVRIAMAKNRGIVIVDDDGSSLSTRMLPECGYKAWRLQRHLGCDGHGREAE